MFELYEHAERGGYKYPFQVKEYYFILCDSEFHKALAVASPHWPSHVKLAKKEGVEEIRPMWAWKGQIFFRKLLELGPEKAIVWYLDECGLIQKVGNSQINNNEIEF